MKYLRLKTMVYATLSISLLAIVVTTLTVLINTRMKRQPRLTTRNLLVELLRESNQRNQTLTNLIVSRDFQTFAGLQSLSPQNPYQMQMIPSPNSTYSSPDYIPRDDATEAERLKNFGAASGYGETIFDGEPDDDSAQLLRDMIASGQVELGEEGF